MVGQKGVHGCGAQGSGGERQEEALNMMRKKREGTSGFDERGKETQ